jgi:hypothetical protein
VVAALQPHPAPPVRTVITAAPPSASRAASTGSLALEPAPEQTRSAGAPAAPGWPDELAPGSCPAPAPAPRPAEVVPLSAELSRLHVTVSKRFARKLEEARSARPDATDEELLEAGLDLVLAQVEKRRGLVEHPRQKPRPSKPEHIPAQVFRDVWTRDGGRCQWKLANGETRLHAPSPARPHHSAGAGRDLHRREPQDPLQVPSPRGGAPRVRGRVDGPVHPPRGEAARARAVGPPRRRSLRGPRIATTYRRRRDDVTDDEERRRMLARRASRCSRLDRRAGQCLTRPDYPGGAFTPTNRLRDQRWIQSSSTMCVSRSYCS